ncbi:MAG: hypothetical protein K2H47_09550 [Muribaculaceae bacterium]|nr:hypothetical protein [Muribaculaceae bacterium]
MAPDSRLDKPAWYVLNYIGGTIRNLAQKEVERFNSWNDTALELFAPTYVVREEKQGEIKFRTISLTFHYVFVKGTFAEVKRLCAQPNGFSFLIDHSSAERYAIIDDRQMVNFKNIARAYKNCLPYFPLDEIDLEDGDLVEVVKGDFPGLIGTFMPKAKSKTGNIVLNVYNKVGTIAFDVKATDVRVLEFSSHSTRANDQIDAFVPHLLNALRYFDRDEALPTALAAKLSVFCGRMDVAKLNNRKLDARLQVLLYAANHIIGNMPEAAKALAKYERVKDSVTNEWTKGVNNLILSVIAKDKDSLLSDYEKLKQLEPSSKAQQMVRTEYDYYLSPESSL